MKSACPRPKCPACSAGNVRHAFDKEDYAHHKCTVCGLLFVWPTPSPSELAAYYTDPANELNSVGCWETVPIHKYALWKWMLYRCKRLVGVGPLLDLGCGAGYFLEYAGKHDWHDLVGIDASEEAVRMARTRVPQADLHCATDWKALKLAEHRYAVISLLDVLEHLPVPGGFLTELRPLFIPGGVVIMTLPHAHGLSMRVFGKKAGTIMPPEHLCYPTLKSMRVLLERTGYTVRHLFSSSIYLKEWLRVPIRVSGKEDGKNEQEAGQERRYRFWYDCFTGRLASCCVALMDAALQASRLGDQLVVIATKD